MQGLMQDRQLLVSSILEFAAQNHGAREIVSHTVEEGVHRYTYAEANRRAKTLARVLAGLGVKPGDRVASLAWNGYRHFEIWYAVSGMGAVCHTVNPRLFKEQIAYIINHAEDILVFLDTSFVGLLEGMADQLSSVKGFVIMTDEAHMPETALKNAQCYETLMAGQSDDFTWPQFDEQTASSLCYTSGTTGNPKGVLYSHRSTVIHTYATAMVDAIAASSADTMLPVVPMFHANAWGVPYSAPMVGAKLVFNGPLFDGSSLQAMITDESVSCAAAVPTVWLALLHYLQESGKRLDSLERVIIGGSACPRSMIEAFQNNYGVQVYHAWGMTETSPIGTIGTLKARLRDLPADQQIDYQCKQGHPPFGVELRITDDGKELPHDGVAFGHLMVRGPWVTSGYFKSEGGEILDEDGWFDTGDVATIDPEGYIQITDRSKDVIKSGGEWISSIDLENIAVGHPAVAEAAVIGVRHPKWEERPLLIVIKRPGESLTREEMLTFFNGKIAKWWMPDDVVFVDDIPHTATGKIQKLALRQQFKDYVLSGT
jgi:fatty-acyl-CoA synthase